MVSPLSSILRWRPFLSKWNPLFWSKKLSFSSSSSNLTCFVSCHVSKALENVFQESRWCMIDTSIPSLNVTCSHWKTSRILLMLMVWYACPHKSLGTLLAFIRKYYSAQSGLKLLALKFLKHIRKSLDPNFLFHSYFLFLQVCGCFCSSFPLFDLEWPLILFPFHWSLY